MNVGDDGGAHARPKVAHVLAAVALAGLWLAAAAALWRTDAPDLDLPALDPASYFSAGDLERIDAFRRGTRLLWAAGVAVELAVLALLAWRGRLLARLGSRLFRGPVRSGVAVGLLCAAAAWLATLPVAAGAHAWRRRYGLSEQAYGAWVADEALGFAVAAALVSVAVAGALVLASRFPRRWWVVAAPAVAALAVAYVAARPLVVHPLFNRFEPLPDRALATAIEAAGGRMGVRVDAVLVADASRRTTAANAYLSGLGPTRRVVLYDTTLDGRLGEREVVALAAHELAHARAQHVWKGVAWFALLAVPGLFAVARATSARGGLGPARVPLALLVALAFSLATLPLQNALSRRYEAEADWLALEATRDPEAAIALERRLVADALVDPAPPAWARVLLSSHPPALDRIAMAVAYSELRGAPGG